VVQRNEGQPGSRESPYVGERFQLLGESNGADSGLRKNRISNRAPDGGPICGHRYPVKKTGGGSICLAASEFLGQSKERRCDQPKNKACPRGDHIHPRGGAFRSQGAAKKSCSGRDGSGMWPSFVNGKGGGMGIWGKLSRGDYFGSCLLTQPGECGSRIVLDSMGLVPGIDRGVLRVGGMTRVLDRHLIYRCRVCTSSEKRVIKGKIGAPGKRI